MSLILTLFACSFVIVVEFCWGAGLIAAAVSLAGLHGLLWPVGCRRPAALVWQHVLFAVAYATVHVALRAWHPGAYPSLVIADGLYVAALMVVAAALAALVRVPPRH